MLVFDLVTPVDREGYMSNIIKNFGREDYKLLLDTGAAYPVWVSGKTDFDRLFPSAELLDIKLSITGFGGQDGSKVQPSDVYRLDYFPLTDGNECILYKDLIIALHDMDLSCQMIIGFPMLSILKYTYDGYSCPDKPKFTIDAAMGTINVSNCYVGPKSCPFLTGAQVLTQSHLLKLQELNSSIKRIVQNGII